eukprot:7732843-Alexandrium_andersonii.AAC.1
MSASLVGSEMCIRDRSREAATGFRACARRPQRRSSPCRRCPRSAQTQHPPTTPRRPSQATRGDLQGELKRTRGRAALHVQALNKRQQHGRSPALLGERITLQGAANT